MFEKKCTIKSTIKTCLTTYVRTLSGENFSFSIYIYIYISITKYIFLRVISAVDVDPNEFTIVFEAIGTRSTRNERGFNFSFGFPFHRETGGAISWSLYHKRRYRFYNAAFPPLDFGRCTPVKKKKKKKKKSQKQRNPNVTRSRAYSTSPTARFSLFEANYTCYTPDEIVSRPWIMHKGRARRVNWGTRRIRY